MDHELQKLNGLEDPKYVSSIYYIIAQHMKDTVSRSAQIKLWLSESVASCDQLQIDEHSPVLIKHVHLLCGSIFLGVDILYVCFLQCITFSITRKCSPSSCDHTESLDNDINILQDINQKARKCGPPFRLTL